MIRVQRVKLQDGGEPIGTEYKCEGMTITVPIDPVDSETEAKVIRMFKRKIGERMANELKFEITTVLPSKETTVTTKETEGQVKK